MGKALVSASRVVRGLSIDELCALIEDADLNDDVAVMERLVIGATAAPILTRHIRAISTIITMYSRRAKAAGAHEAAAAALGIQREIAALPNSPPEADGQ